MDFRWRDGDRTIRFGRGTVAEAPDLLGDDYVVLTTERGRDAAPAVVEGARAVHLVAPGRVDELAGDLLDEVDGELLVALGGGRVIDVAKALADADPERRRRVAAIPTTLSAAEMTRVHRKARGAAQDTPGVRAAIVLNDPALSASQPADGLAASAANALGHAVEGSLTSLASPVPVLAARDAARQIAEARADSDEPDRDRLALGALLAGYAIDAAWYGVHHVVAQTLVRLAGAGHGPANAALLPHSVGFLRERASSGLLRLDEAAGQSVEELAAALAERAGATRLADLGVEASQLDELAAATDGRPELTLIGAPVTRDEVRTLLGRAL